MAGEFQSIQALVATLLSSANTRQVVIPAGAAATAINSDGAAAAWAWAAYIQIVAALPTNPMWLVGCDMLVWDIVTTDQADVALATGAGGAEVDQAIYAFYCDVAAGAGVYRTAIRDRHLPIRVAGVPRFAGRIRKASAASGTGITVRGVFLTGLPNP